MILSLLSILLGSILFYYTLTSPRSHFKHTDPDKMHRYFSMLMFTPFGFLLALSIGTILLGIVTMFYPFHYYWLVLLILLAFNFALYNWEIYICSK